MGFDLSKGSSFDLSKEAPGLKTAGVGLGWKAGADLDVSAICLGDDDHIPEMTDLVYYKSSLQTVLEGEKAPRPYSTDQAVFGSIDELEGEDEAEENGDVEDMWIYFDRVADHIKKIIVVVTIHDAAKEGISFQDVSGCYCRIWNQENEEEILRYTLNDDFGACDAVEIGRFEKGNQGNWSFKAVGEEHKGGLMAFIKKYAYKFA